MDFAALRRYGESTDFHLEAVSARHSISAKADQSVGEQRWHNF